MSLPLDSVRIISIEQHGAGPFGTQHLAGPGADTDDILQVLERSDERRRSQG